MSDHVSIEIQTCYSKFLTIMFDTKEAVHQAYEVLKEGSNTFKDYGNIVLEIF